MGCTGDQLAYTAAARATPPGNIKYSKEDCQCFVENCLKASGGGSHDWSGSNHMYREAVTKKGPIAGDIPVGSLVFKGRSPGSSGYDLPSRYKSGGDRYNGDLTDYYHVGIYLGGDSVAHSTKGNGIDGARVDHSLSSWTHYGLCRYVSYETQEPSIEPVRRIMTAIDILSGVVADLNK